MVKSRRLEYSGFGNLITVNSMYSVQPMILHKGRAFIRASAFNAVFHFCLKLGDFRRITWISTVTPIKPFKLTSLFVLTS